MSYKILHFTIDYNETLGAFNFLTKLRHGLCKYGVSQKYLIYNYQKRENAPTPEDVFFYEDLDVEKFLQNLEKETVIIFHESFATYVTDQVPMPIRFYQLTENFPRVRMIHDYSTAVCPLFLDYNKYKDCQGTLHQECLEKSCISLDLYRRFSEAVQQLKDYDGIMCLSKNTIKRIMTYGFYEDDFFKIPPLIRSELPDLNVKRDRKSILYASRINRQKGLEYLIRALITLKDLDWKLIVAGEIEDKSYYLNTFRLARKEGILDRIEIKGHLGREQLARVRKKASIFCFPSICHETFGFSGAEAILSGLPVVAFDIEGVDEWLRHGENGFCCKLDTDDFASHLKLLLTDDAVYHQLQAGCMQDAVRNDYDYQMECIFNYLKKIVEKRTSKYV